MEKICMKISRIILCVKIVYRDMHKENYVSRLYRFKMQATETVFKNRYIAWKQN